MTVTNNTSVPASIGLSKRAWWTAVVYVATVAMFLRFFDLPLKPLHHDEGVNALILTGLVNPPHSYRYDPANYHGPTLYYFGWLSSLAFGLTTVGIRFVTAICGLLAVLLVLALRRHIGSIGALSAASLLALSPGAVYYSRYFIHEIPLVCFTVMAVVAATKWIDSGRARYLCGSAIAAALMFATKETWIIAAVVLTGATAGAALLSELHAGQRHRTSKPVWRQVAAILAGWGSTAIARFRQRCGPLLMTVAAALFFVVSILLYTSLFTHWQGAVDAVKTLAIWTKTGTTAHTRAWHTYLYWLWQEESPLLILGVAGAALALWRRENPFAAFTGIWTLGIIAAYSVIPYKTPWLTLNMTAPLAISSGYACELAWRRRAAMPKGVGAFAAAGIVCLMGYQTVMLNFVRYDDDRYPYVYAHTSRELLGLVEEIHRIEQLNPGTSVAVTSRDHFPLSWYLRDYPVGYYGRVQVTNDPLVVASEEQQPSLEPALGDRYERVGAYSLRPGVQLILYARRDLRRSRSSGTSAALFRAGESIRHLPAAM